MENDMLDPNANHISGTLGGSPSGEVAVMSVEDVRRANEILNSAGRRAKLASADLNGSTWEGLMRINLDMVRLLLKLVAERAGTRPLTNAELIEVRCAIDPVIRRASTRADQYCARLYVSEGVVRKVLVGADAGVKHAELRKGWELEHVVPLAALLSGTQLLKDPALIEHVSHAFVTPLALVTREEHLRLETKTGNKVHPFSRYGDYGVRVFRMDDFTAIDPATFTWDDHLDLLRKYPSYATGVDFFEHHVSNWREMLT
jgi:hypothetical protein